MIRYSSEQWGWLHAVGVFLALTGTFCCNLDLQTITMVVYIGSLGRFGRFGSVSGSIGSMDNLLVILEPSGYGHSAVVDESLRMWIYGWAGAWAWRVAGFSVGALIPGAQALATKGTGTIWSSRQGSQGSHGSHGSQGSQGSQASHGSQPTQRPARNPSDHHLQQLHINDCENLGRKKGGKDLK